MDETLRAFLAIFLLALVTYISTSNLLENPEFYKTANKFAQMILSVDKVDLFEATGANLPWAGKTYLIYLAVNTREAEDILARFGELTQTIDKEQLAVDNTMPQYDVVIKVRPVKQQCIYGADPTTRSYCFFSLAAVDEKEETYSTAPTDAQLHNNLVNYCKYEVPELHKSAGTLAGWQGKAYCHAEGWPFTVFKCRYVCLTLYRKCDSHLGYAKLTTEFVYTQDRVTVSAGPRSASGVVETDVGTGKSAVLYYGADPVGKIDYVGSLLTGHFCPEGASYYIVNTGYGTKVIPDTVFDAAMEDILNAVNNPVPECSNITSWDGYNACVEALKAREAIIQNKISYINNWADNRIAGKRVEDPVPQDYRSDWYVAIAPSVPVVYPTYRLYLKADWVGILTKVVNVQITKIDPSTVNLVGPSTQTVSIHIKNYSSVEGGVTVSVRCNNNFLVNGQPEYSHGFTINPNEEKVLNVEISYAGGGTEKAVGSCTVEAYPTANPTIKVKKTFTAYFTPRGAYPPNAVVCIDAYTKARTDQYGNIIPGSQERCPEGYKCVEKEEGHATCEKELPRHPGEGETIQLGGATPYLVGIAIILGLIIGFLVG